MYPHMKHQRQVIFDICSLLLSLSPFISFIPLLPFLPFIYMVTRIFLRLNIRSLHPIACLLNRSGGEASGAGKKYSFSHARAFTPILGLSLSFSFSPFLCRSLYGCRFIFFYFVFSFSFSSISFSFLILFPFHLTRSLILFHSHLFTHQQTRAYKLTHLAKSP